MTWLAFKRSRTFGTPTFLRVAAELLSGVLYLHERNVAPRDLKPENGEGGGGKGVMLARLP